MRELCHISKNLYNVTLYSIRQHFFAEKKFLSYNSNYHHCKNNDNYKLLQAGVSQQVMRVVERNFKSFFSLLELAKQGEYPKEKVKIPKYLPEDSYFSLVLSTNAIKIKEGFVVIPLSRRFKKERSVLKNLRIPFPERLTGRTIKEIRIIPKHEARFFEIEYIYEQPYELHPVDPNKALSVDLGLNNLASFIATGGASFLIDGKHLKSINRWYNKENARLQSIKDKQGIKGITNLQARLLNRRNNRVRDCLNKTARYIINYCVLHGIGKIVVGHNPEWKQEINLGSRNNQNFVQIPHSSLILKLRALCERYGIELVEQEESYTSKASFLDKDNIPVYNPENKTEYTFSGKRVKRGLYRSREGFLVNADTNGAANILKKSNHRLDFQRVARGLLANPLRVRLV
ncbi:RNA-guided endonuclease InsQ/TnpB family protein [Pelotomaculum propionicicum]|uniref:RNA-guided endonuclease InsQ/TnpB family protein n=1 Tax=Pelotomaculum propionicicum TaxID=258475 RepID=UPI003B7F9950